MNTPSQQFSISACTPQNQSAPILVTGSAGFIGANFVHEWLKESNLEQSLKIISLDKLTYAGNKANLAAYEKDPRHLFVHGDIGDAKLVQELLNRFQPCAIINFAAESHVDRSINAPEEFVQTNIVGTHRLLEVTRATLTSLSPEKQKSFRFLHVSTDEVYGSLAPQDPAFTEDTPFQPNSPYAASKASSDHLVRAYHHTYGMPTLTTNCSNNYGPYQFPEKLIPLMINNALTGKALPVYGDGQNVRDWLYVGDHCSAIRQVLAKGRVGQTYNIGGCNELKNLDVVHVLCDILDQKKPMANGQSYRSLIKYVTDRPGHDRRYAINATKIQNELGWNPVETFATGIAKTINWYLENAAWVETITTGTYRQWLETNYASGIRALS